MVTEALRPDNKGEMKDPAMTTPRSKAATLRGPVRTDINIGADAVETKSPVLLKQEAPMRYLDWKVVGLAAGTFLSFSYVLCVAYDIIFPQHAMYEAWYRLLPGFRWLTWTSFFLGLMESFLYGVYAGLVFAPLYNLFNMKFGRS